jgi:hypothetical protein
MFTMVLHPLRVCIASRESESPEVRKDMILHLHFPDDGER